MAIKPIEILINAKDNASAVFGSLQTKVAAVGAAIAAYFGISAFSGVVKGAADLEQALSRVQAATGATGKEMADLRTAAEQAGATTKFTSTEAAAALENLAKAGLNSKDAIATLPAVLALAQAGDIELATASEYVTKAVMGMGLAFTDAGRVSDVLAKGANATNTSVDGLAQALSYAAPVANSLGLSLESTVAIIGKFADAGIDASRAGTALNSILSQFADPASKFRNELAAAGITTGNFEQALHQLAAAGPAGSKAINAVGTEAGPALRALLNQGMGALDGLTASLKNSQGSAAAAAEVMQNNLNGALNGLSSAWDTVKNALGTPVLPVLKDGVDQLAGALRGAVADGTVKKFGDAIAAAFQAGIKWVREFLVTIDFAKFTADLQSMAERTGEAFTQIGNYATNAGNIVKLAYGVMSAGANGALATIYKVGEAFAGVAGDIQASIATIMEKMAGMTFGPAADALKKAAAEVRVSADATGAAADALAEKSRQAFLAMADGAQTARDGFSGLVDAIDAGGAAAENARAAISALAREEAAAAKQTEASIAAMVAQVQASAQAAQSATANADAVRAMREEYAALVQAGDLQAAAAKLQELNKAMAQSAASAEGMAAQVAAAFQRLGVTSSEELTRQAANAQRDYQTIKESGTATAQDLSAAFKKAADDAIAANKGIAPSWVTAEASTRGYKVQVDEAGKATLEATKNAKAGLDDVATGHRSAGSAAREQVGSVQALADAYTDAGAKALAAQGQFLAAAQAQKNADTSASSITNRKPSASQGVWTQALIIDYLKQSGLDEMLATNLSKQFLNSSGGVDYEASSAQKRWAGNFGTLSEALGKVSQYYQYNDSGKSEAANILAYEKEKAAREEKVRQDAANLRNGTTTPAPAPAPGTGTGTGTGTGSVTYVNNITINGAGDWGSVRGTTTHTTSASAQTEIELLRALAQAKGASSV